MSKAIVVAASSASMVSAAESRAAELVIFSTGSMSEPMKEIGEEFMHKTGHKLVCLIGTDGRASGASARGRTAREPIAISAEGADALTQKRRFSGAREPFRALGDRDRGESGNADYRHLDAHSNRSNDADGEVDLDLVHPRETSISGDLISWLCSRRWGSQRR